MGRYKKEDRDRKKPRNVSATDNEWDHATLKAISAGKDLSNLILKKLGVTNKPLTEKQKETLENYKASVTKESPTP